MCYLVPLFRLTIGTFAAFVDKFTVMIFQYSRLCISNVNIVVIHTWALPGNGGRYTNYCCLMLVPQQKPNRFLEVSVHDNVVKSMLIMNMHVFEAWTA